MFFLSIKDTLFNTLIMKLFHCSVRNGLSKNFAPGPNLNELGAVTVPRNPISFEYRKCTISCGEPFDLKGSMPRDQIIPPLLGKESCEL